MKAKWIIIFAVLIVIALIATAIVFGLNPNPDFESIKRLPIVA